jgi:hypothetical protein
MHNTGGTMHNTEGEVEHLFFYKMFSQVQEIQETEEKMNLLVIQILIHLKGYPCQVKVINMVNSIKIKDIHNIHFIIFLKVNYK